MSLPLMMCNPQIVRLSVEKRPEDRPHGGCGPWGLYGYDDNNKQIWASVGFRTKADASRRLSQGCLCTVHAPRIGTCPYCGLVLSAVTFTCVRGSHCPGERHGTDSDRT